MEKSNSAGEFNGYTKLHNIAAGYIRQGGCYTLDWKISEKNPYNLYGSEKLITVLEYFVVRSSNKNNKYAKYYCAYIFARL